MQKSHFTTKHNLSDMQFLNQMVVERERETENVGKKYTTLRENLNQFESVNFKSI